MGTLNLSFRTVLVTAVAICSLTGPAMASHEILKCDVYSYGSEATRDEKSELLVRPLSVQGRVIDGQAKLKGTAADVRPLENKISPKLFAREPVHSPIQYEASLIDGKISIQATADVPGGEKEFFSVTRPAAPELKGQFPGVTLKARLRSTLEPELRFDDNITDRFEIQCLHMQVHE